MIPYSCRVLALHDWTEEHVATRPSVLEALLKNRAEAKGMAESAFKRAALIKQTCRKCNKTTYRSEYF